MTKLKGKLKNLRTDKITSTKNEFQAGISKLLNEIFELIEQLSEALPAKHVKEKDKRYQALRKSTDLMQRWLNNNSFLKNEKLNQLPEGILTRRLMIKIWNKMNDFIERSGWHAKKLSLDVLQDDKFAMSINKSWSGKKVVIIPSILSVVFWGMAGIILFLFQVQHFEISKALENVVQVQTPKSKGTGFIINHANLMVTNYHVVEPFMEVTIKSKRKRKPQLPQRTFKARLISYDETNDIAILQLSEPYSISEFPLGFTMKQGLAFEIGQNVHVIGNPVGLSDVYTTGKIIKVQNDLAFMDVEIGPGNSGGPVCDDNGEVIGITTAYANPEQSSFDFGIAVPSARAWELISTIPQNKLE